MEKKKLAFFCYATTLYTGALHSLIKKGGNFTSTLLVMDGIPGVGTTDAVAFLDKLFAALATSLLYTLHKDSISCLKCRKLNRKDRKNKKIKNTRYFTRVPSFSFREAL